MEITSLTNSKVKEWTKLKEKKYRDITNTFLIEGDHLVNEALKRGIVKEIISIDLSFLKENIPFYLVTIPIMKKISDQVSISPVIAVCTKIPEKPINGAVCLLDNIQDPGNLGTIIRSAVAFNIDTLILSLDTVDLYNPKVIRASEGMLFNINIIRKDISTSLKELKENNYLIYGTDVSKGTNLKTLEFPLKSAIIIGSEGKGMDEYLKKECDSLINIPLNNNCESLNASIAASIIFYEMRN